MQAQTIALGDDVSRPIPGAGHDYIKGLSETVMPSNGSLHITIDLPVPKGRGLTLPFAITYDSGEVYQFASLAPGTGEFAFPAGGQSGPPTDLSQAGGGWGNTLPYASAVGSAVEVTDNSGIAIGYCPMSSSYNFYDPSGGSHMLGLAAIGFGYNFSDPYTPGAVCGNQTYNGKDYYYRSYSSGGDDQVYAEMDASCNGIYSQDGPSYPTDCDNANPAFTVTDLNGLVYVFNAGAFNPPGAGGNTAPTFMYPAFIEDRNGNKVNFTSINNGGGYGLPVTDTAGRTLVSSANSTTYTVGGLQYTLNHQSGINPNFAVASLQIYPLQHPLPQSVFCGFTGAVSGSYEELTSIGLPNGQSYSFQYDPTYGLLDKITYPDGGWVQYTWGLSSGYTTLATFDGGLYANGWLTNGLSGGCDSLYQTPVIVKREVGYSSSSTPAQTQTFTYTTNWNQTGTTDPSGYTGDWTSKQTTVTTTDNVTGIVDITNYAYTPIFQPGQPDAAGQIPAQIPVEASVQDQDGNLKTLKTVTKAWADQFEMISETTTLSNTPSYGVAYCYNLYNTVNGYCSLPSGFPEEPQVKFEYDFGQVPSTMPPPLSSPGATRTTTYEYAGIPHPCFFTLPITNQTSPNPCSIPNGPDPVVPSQIVTYAGSAVFNSSTNSWSGTTRIAETDAIYDAGGTSSASTPQGTHDETNYGPSSPASRGNFTSVTEQCFNGSCASGSPVTSYTYDETGQVTSRTDPRGFTTGYIYTDCYSSGGTPSGNTDAYLTKITDPLRFTEQFCYSYIPGELTSATDENGETTNYTYNDPLNRLTLTQYPDGGSTQISYNDSVPSITTTTAMTGSQSKTSVAVLDGLGHVIHTQLTSDPIGTDYVDTVYDGMGSVYSVSNPYRSTGESTYGLTTYSYDALGRLALTTEPGGSVIQSCYNGVSSLPAVSSGLCSTLVAVNTTPGSITGTWVDSTDENGNHWQRASDAFGRLTQVAEPNGASQPPTMVTDYSYDNLNNLLSVNQWGGPHGSSGSVGRSFSYDSLSQLTSAFNPESGTTTYSYDADGNLASKTDARSVTTSYTYNNLNQVLGKTYLNDPSSTPLSCYQYGTSTSGYTVERLINAWTQSASSQSCASPGPTAGQYLTLKGPIVYDQIGRELSEQQYTPASIASGKFYPMAYTYDLAGNLTSYTTGAIPPSMTPSSGNPCSNGASFSPTAWMFINCYDAAGRLQSVTSNASSSPTSLFAVQEPGTAQAPGYFPFGGLGNAVYGANLSGNSAVSLTREYDDRLRITSEQDLGNAPATATSGSATVTITGVEQSK